MLLIEEWDYLNQGESHFIIRYHGKQQFFVNKVLRLRKLKLTVKPIHQQFDNHSIIVHNYLLKNIPFLQGYFYPQMTLNISQDQRSDFIKRLQQKIESKKKKNKKAILQIDINTPFYLLDNLQKIQQSIQHEFKMILELKPKTGLYDLYSQETVQRICNSNKWLKTQLVKYLESLPQQMRLKFNKKKMIDKNKPNKINSVQFFQNKMVDYLGTNHLLLQKMYKNGVQVNFELCQIPKEDINKAIYGILIKQDIIRKILSIQTIYNKPYQLLLKYDKNKLVSEIKKCSLSEVSETILKKILHQYQNMKIQQLFERSQIDTCSRPFQNENQQLLDILSFLISEVWRDVSIFLQLYLIKQLDQVEISNHTQQKWIRVNPEYIIRYKLHIIDHDMRSLYRTEKKYLDEDQDYLQRLIDSKLFQ